MIAFSFLGEYTKRARDSKRITDVRNIIWKINTGLQHHHIPKLTTILVCLTILRSQILEAMLLACLTIIITDFFIYTIQNNNTQENQENFLLDVSEIYKNQTDLNIKRIFSKLLIALKSLHSSLIIKQIALLIINACLYILCLTILLLLNMK
jgi:hypothetical protein